MEPYQIAPLFEVIGTDGQIDQIYNCVIYRFQDDSAYIRARAYLDEIDTVSVFGPFQSERDLTPVDTPRFLRGCSTI